jgi:hypothetical protein
MNEFFVVLAIQVFRREVSKGRSIGDPESYGDCFNRLC